MRELFVTANHDLEMRAREEKDGLDRFKLNDEVRSHLLVEATTAIKRLSETEMQLTDGEKRYTAVMTSPDSDGYVSATIVGRFSNSNKIFEIYGVIVVDVFDSIQKVAEHLNLLGQLLPIGPVLMSDSFYARHEGTILQKQKVA